MNISFSCNITGSGGHNFIRLSLHIGDTVLGEGWETLGLTTAALQDVLANLNMLHTAPPHHAAARHPSRPSRSIRFYPTQRPALRLIRL